MALGMPFIYSAELNYGRDFDRKACRHNCPCEVDLIGVLVAGYQAEVRRNWERCLDMKWSMLDYVSGCHNIDEDAERLDRNGHQYRLYLDNIKALAKFLNDKDENYWVRFANADFEQLYNTLSPEIREHKGIGLDANHLENFLCVFHTPLQAYADFLEREKQKKTTLI